MSLSQSKTAENLLQGIENMK